MIYSMFTGIFKFKYKAFDLIEKNLKKKRSKRKNEKMIKFYPKPDQRQPKCPQCLQYQLKI